VEAERRRNCLVATQEKEIEKNGTVSETSASTGALDLIVAMLKIGCIGFGGGNVLIPVIQKKVVEEKAFVSSEEYEEDVVVASITPGALPVELAGGVGKRFGGRKWMFICAMTMALPGVALTVGLLSAFSGIRKPVVRQVQFLTTGITAFIVMLLLDYIYKTFRGVRRKTVQTEQVGTTGGYGICLLLAGGVFLLTCGKNLYRILGIEGTPVFCLTTLQVFAIAFFWILFTNGKRNARNGLLVVCGCRGWKPYGILCDAAVLAGTLILTTVLVAAVTGGEALFIWKGFLSSVISFGGGDAYLTVADGLFVQSSMIQEEDFYGKIVPLVNVLPGSILCKTLSAVGYCVGYQAGQSVWKGYLVALCGFLCSVVASCSAFSIAGDIYRNCEELPFFRLMKKWIRPIVSGLMGTVILSLFNQSLNMGSEFGMGRELVLVMLLICAADVVLGKKFHISNGKLLVFSAAVSYVACAVMV
jgi:chromate transporter